MLCKYLVYTLSAAALTSGTVIGKCAPLDVCILALRGGVVFSPRLKQASMDCAENLAISTITRTETKTLTFSNTATALTTSTENVWRQITVVNPQTTTTVETVVPTNTIRTQLFPDEELSKRTFPIFDLPIYAIPCLSNERYESACSCIGVPAPTITPTSVITVTKTSYVSVSKTLTSVASMTYTETRTESPIVSTVTSIVAATTSAIYTIVGPFQLGVYGVENDLYVSLYENDSGEFIPVLVDDRYEAYTFSLEGGKLRVASLILYAGMNQIFPIRRGSEIPEYLQGRISPMSCTIGTDYEILCSATDGASMFGIISDMLYFSDSEQFFRSNGGYRARVFAFRGQQG